MGMVQMPRRSNGWLFLRALSRLAYFSHYSRSVRGQTIIKERVRWGGRLAPAIQAEDSPNREPNVSTKCELVCVRTDVT